MASPAPFHWRGQKQKSAIRPPLLPLHARPLHWIPSLRLQKNPDRFFPSSSSRDGKESGGSLFLLPRDPRLAPFSPSRDGTENPSVRGSTLSVRSSRSISALIPPCSLDNPQRSPCSPATEDDIALCDSFAIRSSRLFFLQRPSIRHFQRFQRPIPPFPFASFPVRSPDLPPLEQKSLFFAAYLTQKRPSSPSFSFGSLHARTQQLFTSPLPHASRPNACPLFDLLTSLIC